MIIIYNPQTGTIESTAEVSLVAQYKALLDKLGKSYIEVDAFRLALDLSKYIVKEGKLYQLNEMQLTLPTGPLYVGQEFAINCVPQGASMSVNDGVLGTMDATGLLEFTPETAGTYQFTFAADGYVTKGVSLEVLSQA